MVTRGNAPSIQAIKGMFFQECLCLFDIIYPSQYRCLPRVWGKYGILVKKSGISGIHRDRIGNKRRFFFKSNVP
jgi:hypothetical protein